MHFFCYCRPRSSLTRPGKLWSMRGGLWRGLKVNEGFVWANLLVFNAGNCTLRLNWFRVGRSQAQPCLRNHRFQSQTGDFVLFSIALFSFDRMREKNVEMSSSWTQPSRGGSGSPSTLSLLCPIAPSGAQPSRGGSSWPYSWSEIHRTGDWVLFLPNCPCHAPSGAAFLTLPHHEHDTHVVPPRDLVCRRIGLDDAREVDVVPFLQIARVHHSAEGESDVWRNCNKRID